MMRNSARFYSYGRERGAVYQRLLVRAHTYSKPHLYNNVHIGLQTDRAFDHVGAPSKTRSSRPGNDMPLSRCNGASRLICVLVTTISSAQRENLAPFRASIAKQVAWPGLEHVQAPYAANSYSTAIAALPANNDRQSPVFFHDNGVHGMYP
jgi:hypothetical protein